MRIRNLRIKSRLSRFSRRPYIFLLAIFTLILLTYLIICPYFKYILYLSSSIHFIGDLPSDTLYMKWANRRPLRDYVRPEKMTEILSPATVYCSTFLVLITTIVPHYDQRQAIRDTWGQDMNVYFFLGMDSDKKKYLKDLPKLIDENTIHEDLIVEDFIESYYNLTLKTGFLMKWATRHCPNAEYILKTDDDMFVNPQMLKRSVANVSASSRSIIGYLISGSRAHHDPESKWYLPTTMYAEDILPNYISGSAYLMTGKAMKEIYAVGMDVPFMSLEDILFTGLLSKKVNATLIYDPTYTETKPPWNILQWSMGTLHCGYRRLSVAHRVPPRELRQIWSTLNEPICDRVCSTWLQTKLVDLMSMFL